MNRVAWASCALAPFLLVACDQAVIEGLVTDASGEPLPGVVVQVAPSGQQDLSDARGRYHVRASAGDLVLSYSKSGYAQAELSLAAVPAKRVHAGDVALWRLPLNPGVYIVRNYQYERADWLVPKQYYLKEGSVVHGIERPPNAFTTSPMPFIVCYHTPRYDARISRMVQAQATRPATKSATFDVWVPAGTLSVVLEPVDRPQEHLLRIDLDRPLEPGIYAVHWGALEGYTTLDNRVFLFEVLEPSEGPLPEMEPDESEAESKPKPPKPPAGNAPMEAP